MREIWLYLPLPHRSQSEDYYLSVATLPGTDKRLKLLIQKSNLDLHGFFHPIPF